MNDFICYFTFPSIIVKTTLVALERAEVLNLHKIMRSMDLQKFAACFQGGAFGGLYQKHQGCVRLWGFICELKELIFKFTMSCVYWSFVLIGTSDSLLINWVARGRWRHSILIIPVSNVCIISLFN